MRFTHEYCDENRVYASNRNGALIGPSALSISNPGCATSRVQYPSHTRFTGTERSVCVARVDRCRHKESISQRHPGNVSTWSSILVLVVGPLLRDLIQGRSNVLAPSRFESSPECSGHLRLEKATLLYHLSDRTRAFQLIWRVPPFWSFDLFPFFFILLLAKFCRNGSLNPISFAGNCCSLPDDCIRLRPTRYDVVWPVSKCHGSF
jgi:hypothetical protein